MEKSVAVKSLESFALMEIQFTGDSNKKLITNNKKEVQIYVN